MLSNSQDNIFFNDILSSFSLESHKDKITRPLSNTLIDNFFTNLPTFEVTNSFIVFDDLSDHLPILLTIKLTNKNQTQYIRSLETRAINYSQGSIENNNSFKEKLKNSELYETISDNVNLNLENYQTNYRYIQE